MELVRLAEGVYAAVRSEPLGLAVNDNSLIVVGDDGVLVVDAQVTRQATLETIAAIRGVTSRPVRYVVNTHWHDDHFAGNQVYRDSFPSAQFVMHANTRADMALLGAPNRAGTRDGAPSLVQAGLTPFPESEHGVGYAGEWQTRRFRSPDGESAGGHSTHAR